MSSTDSVTQHRNYITIKDPHPPVTISLNEVFKESMKMAQPEGRGLQLIVRCESLPSVKGRHEELKTLFALLIRMIIENPLPGPSRFLYIDCEEQRVSESSVSKDPLQYLVKFYTNCSSNDEWRIANRETIAKCQEIVSAHHGSLAVNNITHTGCLFLITLPGKLE